MHGHSCERIWTKLGMWHMYTLRVVTDRLASAAHAHGISLRAPSIYAAANRWSFVGNSQLTCGRCNGPSAVGGMMLR